MNAKAKNARIKREYATYLKEAKRQSEASIDKALASIAAFEKHTRYADFAAFKKADAISFKDALRKQRNLKTNALISESTIVHVLQALKSFFVWLPGRQGYRRTLSYADADYFNPSNRETRIGRADRDPIGPTIEQVRHVVGRMSNATPIEKRDRALVAFTLLSGVRDAALVSLRLGDVELATRSVDQDARYVKTKAAKTIRSTFFPVGEPFENIVADWIGFLRAEMLFGPGDPLFPRTKIVVSRDQGFKVDGLDRAPWATTAPVRSVFKEAFASAGLPYANPHSFRNTLVRFGLERCRTPEELKAWSQNLGHDRVMMTVTSYGAIDRVRVAAIMNGLRVDTVEDKPNLAADLQALLASHGLRSG